MCERDLNRAVARATGESVEAIQRLGFSLTEDDDPDAAGPLVVDWDDQEPAFLGDLLSADDWPSRVAPLPSYDEESDWEELWEDRCAAA